MLEGEIQVIASFRAYDSGLAVSLGMTRSCKIRRKFKDSAPRS
jgi:hypothetical protein